MSAEHVHSVGLVTVTCPACGDAVETNVKVAKVELTGGRYLRVDFHQTSPEHTCLGRRN